MQKLLPKLKYVFFVLAILLIALIFIKFVIPKIIKPPQITPKEVRLSYWGLFEPKEAFQPLIDEYKKQYEREQPGSNIQINYEMRTYDTLEQYKEGLLNRLSMGTGPDILRVHATWIPQFSAQFASLSGDILSAEEYEKTFYPVAKNLVTVEGDIYAIPLMYEGLLLLLNEDLFQEANLAIPKAEDQLTWNEFRHTAVALTKIESGKIVQAGAAIGLSENVPHSSDILGLMWAQSGFVGSQDLSTDGAQAVLEFYADFFREDKVWDTSFPSSIAAFSSGRVAMIFAPSWRIFEIERTNPGLNFTTTAVPQIPSEEGLRVTWATFWVEAVSKDTEYPKEAWEFLKFLSLQENQKRLYSLATQLRAFGEPYSHQDLKKSLSTHKYLAPLMEGATFSESWLITDYSGNKPYVDIIGTAVNAVAAQGQDPMEALKIAQETLVQLIAKNKAGLP